MRFVGNLPPGRPAGGLAADLSARELEAVVRHGELWVLDEQSRAEAGRRLEHFRRAPDDPCWRLAIRGALERSEAEARRAERELSERGRWSWRRERRLRQLFAASPASRPLTLAMLALGGLAAWLGPHEASALIPSLVSLYCLHELGTHAEALLGTRRFAVLVASLMGASQLALAVTGLGLAGLAGAGFGLLGFTAVRSRLDPQGGLRLARGLLSTMLIWLLACSAGAVPVEMLLAQCAGLSAGLCWGAGPPLLLRLRSRPA